MRTVEVKKRKDRKMKKLTYILLICSIAFSSKVLAKKDVDFDSLKTYKLGEITAVSDKPIEKLSTSSINNTYYYEIQKRDAPSVADIAASIPSAFVQTNSRGQTLVYLRGSGERQLGLFLDGAYMNVPWDNRMDFEMIPSDIIGMIRTDKGAGSVLYGPNILGGAVSVNTIERKSDGYGAQARLQAGDGASKYASITTDGRSGNLNYIANFSYYASDGAILPNEFYDSGLENQSENSYLRTNTDKERINAYARLEYRLADKTALGLSLNHINAEKGVAPLTEGGPSDFRYWRYPEWKRTIATLNAEHTFSFDENLKFKSTFWLDKFDQAIDSYEGLSYSTIDEKQRDDDLTLGARAAFSYSLTDEQTLSFVLNGLNSRHEETIVTDGEEKSEFEQNLLSSGLEYKISLGDLFLNAGAGYDYNSTPKTGVFTEFEGSSQGDWAGFFGARYDLTRKIGLFANVSRRTRFPTMRESYSGALGKFKVNPNLRPESGVINELGLNFNYGDFYAKFTGFASFYDDLMQKTRLSEEEDSLRRKMRVNFSQSLISGAEFSFRYNPANSFYIDGYATYMNSSGENKTGEEIEHLEYKPQVLAFLTAKYDFHFGFTPQAEIKYVGERWGIGPSDEYEKLDSFMSLSLRFAYKLKIAAAAYSELYIRVDNLLDEASYTKIGLPNPGRTLLGGVLVRI